MNRNCCSKLVSLIVVFNLICYIQGCHFIQNVEMEIYPRTGEPFNMTVNSCIERVIFNTTVIKVKVKNQNIKHITVGTVRNMPQLQLVSFDGCSIETMEPIAFRNAPRLGEIILIHSPIKKIVKGVFNDGGLSALNTIRINNNKINVIEDEAFANIPTLRKISAAKNKIDYWNRKWFTNSTALIDIDFRNNLIRKIPTKAFENLFALRKIYLDYNDISEIEPGAFDGIKNLVYLGLKHNYLTLIEPDIFSQGLKIESLLLDANRLNFFSHEVLDKVRVLNISLEGNPWKCSCLQTFYYWVNQKNITLQTSPYCDFTNIPACIDPQTYFNTCIEVIDEEVTETYLNTVKATTENNKKFVTNTCVRFE